MDVLLSAGIPQRAFSDYLASCWQNKGKAIQRSGARVGDVVGVSGCLGDARAALDFLGSEGKEMR